MNKIESKFNIKTFIMFLTVLVLSLSMVFATACKNGESSSESTSTSESTTVESESEEAKDDPQLFANGDFEHPTNKYPSSTPITLSSSSTKWTGSVDGDIGFQINSGDVKRGIIDVAPAAYDKLGSDYKESENPSTPVLAEKMLNDVESDADEAGTRVLMLRNKEYAAQYVTSATTLSVPAGSYAKLSVWVRTSDIANYSDAGAYIKVKHNVSNPSDEGATYDPLMIYNIDTNKEWVEYVIYITPNTSKASTFTLVLGLGEGNKLNVEKHVKGWAYFDNISFELINKATYDDATVDTTVKVVNSSDVYSLNGEVNGATNKQVKFDLSEGSAAPVTLNGAGEYLDYTYNGEHSLAKEGASLVDNVLTIDFSSLSIGSAYTYTSQVFDLNASTGRYARISLWAKIDAEDYQTMATIALKDAISGKDVAVFENVSTKDHEDEINGNYARFTFYVANNFATDTMQYQLKLSFGPTDANSIDVKLLPTGTATFKGFEIEYLTKENYDLANVTSDTRAKKVALIGSYDSDYVAPEDDEDEETTDSYNVTVSGFGKTQLEAGSIVTLDQLTSSNLVRSDATTENAATIGVVNSKHTYTSANVNAALAAVQGKLDGMRVYNSALNKNVQALLVHNQTGTNFVSGNIVSISANSTYVFSIQVYAHADAKAFVKLALVEDSENGDKFPVNDYQVYITNADSMAFNNGFATVTFIITTGFEDFDVRLQFGVEGEDKVALFQYIATGSVNSTYTSGEAVKTAFADNFVFSGDVKDFVTTYHYASEDHVGDLDLVLTDEDDETKKLIDTSNKKEIKATYGTLEGSTTKLVVYNRLNLNDRYVIDVPEEEESASEESTVESGEESEEGGNLGWLQVTSIIIALVLVIALIAVVVRKATEDKNKKKKQTEKYYQGFDKTKFSKNRDVAVPDEDDKSKDYDYDNPDNN